MSDAGIRDGTLFAVDRAGPGLARPPADARAGLARWTARSETDLLARSLSSEAGGHPAQLAAERQPGDRRATSGRPPGAGEPARAPGP